MYDANGRLTRAAAEQAIKEGGSVTLGGNKYTRLDELPPETVFAVGDAQATQRALDGLAAQRKALDEQEAKLHEQNAKVEQAKKDAERAQKDREQREAADRKAKDQADKQQADRQTADAEAETHRRGRKAE